MHHSQWPLNVDSGRPLCADIVEKVSARLM
jgi:hypothetical protein